MSMYTTGEIAKLCGVSVRTVQYYDTRDILVPSELSEGGRRLYSEEDLKRMKIICFLRDLDMPINTISQLFTEEHPENVIDLAALYMRIYFCGVPASLVYNFGAGILRAYGDTKRPMYILSATGVVNVVLNLVLVVFFDMNVAGVAIATIVSQVLSAIVVVTILFNPRGEYKLRLKLLRFHGPQLKKLVSIGIPCGFNGIVFSISNVILQSTVNTFGDIVVASASAANSVNSFVYVFLASFYTACVSFSGQNFGARKYRRIDMLMVRSIVACFSLIVASATLVTIFSDFLLGLYTNDLAVVEAGRPILQMICWSYALYTVPEVCTGCLRGMGESTAPTLLNVFCICGLRFVWIFLIFPMNPVVPMLYFCYPISYTLCGIAQYIYYRRCRNRWKDPIQAYQKVASIRMRPFSYSTSIGLTSSPSFSLTALMPSPTSAIVCS